MNWLKNLFSLSKEPLTDAQLRAKLEDEAWEAGRAQREEEWKRELEVQAKKDEEDFKVKHTEKALRIKATTIDNLTYVSARFETIFVFEELEMYSYMKIWKVRASAASQAENAMYSMLNARRFIREDNAIIPIEQIKLMRVEECQHEY
jgi:hypothetical protein